MVGIIKRDYAESCNQCYITLTQAGFIVEDNVDLEVLDALEIERICPSNAELRSWANESNPPEGLEELQEERPW